MSNKKGWGKPTGALKWHYFNENSMSLCNRYGFYHGDLEDTNHNHSDNCNKCMKLRSKLK